MNAGIRGFDPQGDVRRALAAVVRDHGPDILADPRHLGGALNILLPTAPEETEMLVAAARAGVAVQLAQQAAAVGPGAAVQTVSGNLAQSGVLDPRASSWAVSEIARAMGFPIIDPAPAAPPPGATAAWPGSASVPPPPPVVPPPPPVIPLDFPAAPAADTPPPAAWPSPPAPATPPPPAPWQFVPPLAPAAYTPPGGWPAPPAATGPPPLAGSGPPGPLGQGATGGPPLGPQWVSAGVPVPPPPPSPPPGSGAPGGPPPWTAPARPTRRRGHPRALIAAAVVIVLIIGYFGVAATAGFFPFKATTPVATPTPTPAPTFTLTPTSSPSPSASPTAKASSSAGPSATGSPSLSQLGNLLPTYITGNTADSCQEEPSDAYVATGESDEELCDLTQNSDVSEDYVLYAGFPTETPAAAYFTSLLTANGMKVTQGNCQNLTLVDNADGSSQYCENTYTTTNTKSTSGSDFVFTGNPSFELGDSNPVSSLDVCSDVNSVDVLGFTDPTYAAVGIAISCLGTEQDTQINTDFLAGNFFLGS